jgi:hypothetical protein
MTLDIVTTFVVALLLVIFGAWSLKVAGLETGKPWQVILGVCLEAGAVILCIVLLCIYPGSAAIVFSAMCGATIVFSLIDWAAALGRK